MIHTIWRLLVSFRCFWSHNSGNVLMVPDLSFLDYLCLLRICPIKFWILCRHARHVLRLAERFKQSTQRSITAPAIQLLAKMTIYSFPVQRDHFNNLYGFIMCVFSNLQSDSTTNRKCFRLMFQRCYSTSVWISVVLRCNSKGFYTWRHSIYITTGNIGCPELNIPTCVRGYTTCAQVRASNYQLLLVRV